jgi:hypothetical protein
MNTLGASAIVPILSAGASSVRNRLLHYQAYGQAYGT